MRENVRKARKLIGILGMVCVVSATQFAPVHATENTETETTANTATVESTQQGVGETGAGDIGTSNTGTDSDILVSNVSISNVKAGNNASVAFTLTGGKNTKKKYEVETIESVTPLIDSSSGFVKNSETSRMTSGTSNTLHVSYNFQTKDNVETAYYPVAFTIVYTRKSTDGKKTYDEEYTVTKEFSVKITGKKTTEETAAPETKSADGDISFVMKNKPTGTYGQGCNIAFVAKSDKYKIYSVTPVVDDNFPFDSTSDAYKTTHANGVARLNCQYHFVVKNNATTGYAPVKFDVTYKKNNVLVSEQKVINVSLTGKKEDKKGDATKKKSTPRVMVVGYTTDVEKVMPGEKFHLKLQIKNNAASAVQNVKFTLSTANGEFLPASGASTAFVDRIGAKNTVTLDFVMKASAGLGAKSYVITVKSEYEDTNANAFDATDNVSIPISIKDRLSLSDLETASVNVDDEGEVNFTINNMGVATLNNVTAICKGQNIKGEEKYVGNIAAGASEYVSIPVTGVKETQDDSDAKMTIIIKYENTAGESKSYKQVSEIYVEPAMDMEEIDEEAMADAEPTHNKGKAPIIPIVVGVVIVAGVVVFLVKRKKKKQLLLEQELMEDELS